MDYGQQKFLREDGILLCAHWTRPPDGFVKLNVDGSHSEGGDHIGGGGVIRNSQGKWKLAFSSYEVGENTFQAELGALRDELRLAWNAGFRRVIDEVDCVGVLSALDEVEADQFCPTVEVVREPIHRSWVVHLRWVPLPVSATRLQTGMPSWGQGAIRQSCRCGMSHVLRCNRSCLVIVL
ncbi:uncharacterized protein LOC130743758 [Lotus japonicus]|uniref:uncharacterized protein LOC130743758 n=1 Tax=Lotus japonicus TaxID=34305 RepID=UPI00258D9C53|nr:uncharacterized protein LOC130743758 [Lotus japonicus]